MGKKGLLGEPEEFLYRFAQEDGELLERLFDVDVGTRRARGSGAAGGC